MTKKPYVEVMPATVAKFAQHLMKQAADLEIEEKNPEMVALLKNQAVARYYYACYMKLNQLHRCIKGNPFPEHENHFKSWQFLGDYGYEVLAEQGKQLRLCRNEADYSPSNSGMGMCNDAFYRLGTLFKELSRIFDERNCAELEAKRHESLRQLIED